LLFDFFSDPQNMFNIMRFWHASENDAVTQKLHRIRSQSRIKAKDNDSVKKKARIKKEFAELKEVQQKMGFNSFEKRLAKSSGINIELIPSERLSSHLSVFLDSLFLTDTIELAFDGYGLRIWKGNVDLVVSSTLFSKNLKSALKRTPPEVFSRISFELNTRANPELANMLTLTRFLAFFFRSYSVLCQTIDRNYVGCHLFVKAIEVVFEKRKKRINSIATNLKKNQKRKETQKLLLRMDLKLTEPLRFLYCYLSSVKRGEPIDCHLTSE